MTSRNGPLVRISLICGILSSLVYVAMNVFVAMRWEGYNSASQTVSELSAIGAPTRSLWVLPAAFYTLLVTAFGWGVWKSAGRIRALRTETIGSCSSLPYHCCSLDSYAPPPDPYEDCSYGSV